MKKRSKLIILCLMILVLALPMNVSAKTYKAKSVTAKQITNELKKKIGIKNIKVYNKKTEGSLIGQKNGYKSKTTFIDKKYPKLYCSIEVFSSSNLAYRRAGYLDCLKDLYDDSGLAYDCPFKTYIYKNVLIRLNDQMPTSYEKKYVSYVKKIVK